MFTACSHKTTYMSQSSTKSGFLLGFIGPREVLNTFPLQRFVRGKRTNRGFSTLSLQHVKYPLYGTHWHPEKSQFNWSPRYRYIPRTEEAIEIGAFWAHFIVDQCRKNNNPGFESMGEDLQDYLINAKETKFSGRKCLKASFSQIYHFT